MEGRERITFPSSSSFTWIIIVASVSPFFTLEMFPTDELLLLLSLFLEVILMGERR